MEGDQGETWKQCVTSKERHVNWVNHDFKTFSVVTTTKTRLAANSSSFLIDKRHGVTEVYKKSSFICLLVCYFPFFFLFSFIYSCLFYLFVWLFWADVCLFIPFHSFIHFPFFSFTFPSSFSFFHSFIHPFSSSFYRSFIVALLCYRFTGNMLSLVLKQCRWLSFYHNE